MADVNPQNFAPATPTSAFDDDVTQVSCTGSPTSVMLSDGTIITIKSMGPKRWAEASSGQIGKVTFTASNELLIEEMIINHFSGQEITQVLACEQPETVPTITKTEKTEKTAQNVSKTNLPDDRPDDLRLVYLIDDKTGTVIYSLGTTQEKELVDGFIIPEDASQPDSPKTSANNPTVNTAQMVDFYGVPSIMNPNAYIRLGAAGGKGNNKYLIDRDNQPRWYDAQNPSLPNSNLGPAKTPTTTNIINWSNEANNRYKFPYKYQDFVFCKWWQKIPNNYMVTLRRYPYPTNDQVTSSAEGSKEGSVIPTNLFPVATMITYLGEESSNKISAIIGPIESGLKWKNLKADVWEVSQSVEHASANNPAPGLAKALGFMQSGAAGAKPNRPPMQPVDPYNNGPYANKILGPVNVIDSVKIRDRGLEFKHEIKLTFEYSIRSIGGINTKAAALDIIGNILVMTSASASFWGGMNRHSPQVLDGAYDPFLGGAGGRNAWVKGDPQGFFNAVNEQFHSILTNIGDFFNQISKDPMGGLAELATKGASEFMKLNSLSGRGTVSGLHSLLTGQSTGEWHLQVGSPFNPIMMIGNLICSNVKIEFNDELGPDDFPTELKATITLEHARPRDKDDIEAMFNAGTGRIYALPKGYADSLSSSAQSQADTSGTTYGTDKFYMDGIQGGNSISATEAGKGGQGSHRAIIHGSQSDRNQRPDIVGGSVAYDQKYSLIKTATTPMVRSQHVALYGLGTVWSGLNAQSSDIKKEES